ncbi:MAG: galactokinase [Bdellovibrionales bacterium]|nr:galactokinase [Bdellovibrionales bacterium]
MKISKKSCTRVDLSGGTLDCWPLYLLVDSCVTVNLSISISTYASIEERTDKSIDIHMRDMGYRKSFADLKAALNCADPELKLVQKQLAYWKPTKGFNLETFSESPIGGGLGGSSSLSISLIKAFSEWLDVKLNVQESVILSHNLEAQVLHKMTGTQDYFPALSPGLNAIHYTPQGPRLETLSSQQDFWNEHLSLVYTGQPHHSGLNNWQVIKASLDSDPGTLRALADIRNVSWDLYNAVKAGQWDGLPRLFDREFEARVRLSSSFSSPQIERLREVALKAGAQAVKICGAGGGGCVLVWSAPGRRNDVESGCRAQGFEVLNAKAVV